MSLFSQDKPYIIAEMSGNHNQSLERALSIVDAAAAAGVSALKIQTYTADTMTLDSVNKDFIIDDPHSLWRQESLYGLYQKAYTPWDWHQPIFDRCRERGIVGFSTPFDDTAVDFLESLDMPFYKIASFENNHLPLLRKVAKTGKPVIMSTGLASLAELADSVATLREAGCPELILLKCTSSYPADPSESNLRTIPHMRDLFGCEVGLSDHTLGMGVALAGIALGARIIEKHFTLDRADGGVDSAFSLEPWEMKLLVEEAGKALRSLGGIHYGPMPQEQSSLRFRRSIYAAQNIEQGETFTLDNLKVIRPGFGLAPKYYDIVLGRKSARAMTTGTPMDWTCIGE